MSKLMMQEAIFGPTQIFYNIDRGLAWNLVELGETLVSSDPILT